MKKITVISLAIIMIASLVLGASHIQNDKNPENKIITMEDLMKEMRELEKINAYPNNKKIDSKEYPKVLGEYSENGLILIENYFCSDVCPDYGSVRIIFQEVHSIETCATANGQDIIDFAWGGYIGCAPVLP